LPPIDPNQWPNPDQTKIHNSHGRVTRLISAGA
jgi:hypothetical protein